MNLNSIKLVAASLVLTAITPVVAVAAVPVSVTDMVTGGPGAYTHTFSLTNNIGGTNDLYFFGVDLSGTITGTPASWSTSGNQNSGWSNAGYGGSATIYPTTWCCSFGGTPSGTTTPGFSVLSTLSPSTINFFAYAYGGDDSAADGHFSASYNPGFEGVVSGSVPEPATWALMLVGFGGVGVTVRAARRKQDAISA